MVIVTALILCTFAVAQSGMLLDVASIAKYYTTPILVMDAKTYAGGDYMYDSTYRCVVRADGSVTEWGHAQDWIQGFQSAPAGLTNVKSVAVGINANFGRDLVVWAVLNDGTLINWGSPDRPTIPSNLPPIKKVVTSWPFTFAITEDGHVIDFSAKPVDIHLLNNLNTKLVKDLSIGRVDVLNYGDHQDWVFTMAVLAANGKGYVSLGSTLYPLQCDGAQVANGKSIEASGDFYNGYFLVQKQNGDVLSFTNNGTNQTPLGLTNVISIAGLNWSTYGAVRSNGDFVTWNSPTNATTRNVRGAFAVFNNTYGRYLLVDAPVATILDSDEFFLGSTTSTALTVALKAAASQDTTVSISTDASNWIPLPETVTIPAGETKIEVPMLHTAYPAGFPVNDPHSIHATLGDYTYEQPIYPKPFGVYVSKEKGVHVTAGTTFTIPFYTWRGAPLREPIPASFTITGPARLTEPVYLTGDTSYLHLVALDTIDSETVKVTLDNHQFFNIVGNRIAKVTIDPKPEIGVSVAAPATMLGNQRGTGTITLAHPAPDGGTLVWITSDNPNVTVPPEPVKILKGHTTQDFLIKSENVSGAQKANVTVRTADSAASALVAVSPMKIVSLTLDPASVVGGTSTTATLTLAGPVRLDMPVAITLSVPGLGTVPATVTVPALSTSVTFAVQTKPVTKTRSLKVIGSLNGSTKSGSLTVVP